jgi:hypothetical protein
MRILATLVLLLAFGVPARAQQQSPPQAEKVQSELLELEQEVDRTLLREAMLLLGRKGLRPSSERPTSDEARKREAEDAVVLEEYIQRKKRDIVERANSLREMRSEAIRVSRAPTARPRPQGAVADAQGLIERVESAQVEVQLLQTQVQMSQQPLNEAINALAAAELAAGSDETQRAKADTARKEYEKAKSKFVEFSKRFQVEQGKLNEMQQVAGMGGMGGGFR